MAESTGNRGVALIGAGLYPKEAYLPALHATKASLVAIYSRSKRSATELLTEAQRFDGLCAPETSCYHDEAQSGLEQLLQRDDVVSVIVALPTTVQPDVVRRCLEAGKHVLMEKPIAKDVHDAAALIEEYETQFAAQTLILAVAEQFRYDPGHERARQVIADGAIGDLTAVHGRIWQNVQPGNKFYESEWRKKPAYQGGFLLDGGVHFVSLIRYVSGLEIQETASFSKQTFDHLPPVDTVHGALRFSSGALGTLSMTFASAKNEYRYDFIGTKGSVTLTGEDGGTRIVVENAKGQVVSDENVKGNATIEELSAFFSAIGSGNGKVDDRGSPRQALADVAVVESLLTGGGLVRM